MWTATPTVSAVLVKAAGAEEDFTRKGKRPRECASVAKRNRENA